MIEVYTDGGCMPNPGSGSWALVILRNGILNQERSGAEFETTNNRMEMKAVVESLLLLNRNDHAVIYSDSQLIVNTYNQWMHSWAKLGWKRNNKSNRVKSEVKNLDLVQQMYSLYSESVKLVWVRGHDGNYWNEFVDEMCQAELRKLNLT